MALEFVAGCIGGCAGVIVGHPLDTVKVHLQTQDASKPKFNGAVHCLRTLVGKEGVRGVYKGISSPLSGVAVINAIVFGVQASTTRNLGDSNSLSGHFIAGGFAGFAQSFICSPIELAKTRLQVSETQTGLIRCIKNIYKAEGVRGIFRGLNLTIAREVPSFGSYFLTYEFLTRSNSNEPVSTPTMLLAGGCAGVASWVSVYPIDVLKTRIQLDGCSSSPKYLNALDCLRKSVAVEGYACLFRGITPTIVRAFPVNAAIFTVVTWTMRILENNRPSISISEILNSSSNISCTA